MKSKEIFENIKKVSPVVHNISNFITANDCANITLASGGAPTMADDPEEVEEITASCNSFVLNMGIISGVYEESMIRAGIKNNEINHPLVLDPVGAGAAKRRNDVLNRLINNIKFSVIRGNISEIKFIGGISKGTNSPEANSNELVSEENLNEAVEYAKTISKELNSVIVISGAIDIIAYNNRVNICRNGHAIMSKITGTGCMLSSVIGVFIGANKDNIFEATTVAVASYGVAGELAYKKTMEMDGYTSTFKMNLIDYMGKMNNELFSNYSNIEML